MCATWRSRSVGSRVTPTVSATSCPCAQVSMIRAVSDDAALIAGPNHGTRSVGSSGAERRQQRGPRASSNQAQHLGAGQVAELAPRSCPGRPPPVASELHQRRLEAVRVGRGLHGDVVEVRQVRHLVGHRPARGRASADRQPSSGSGASSSRSTADSAARSSASASIDTGIRSSPPDRGALLPERGRALLRVRGAVHRRPDLLGRRRLVHASVARTGRRCAWPPRTDSGAFAAIRSGERLRVIAQVRGRARRG